MNDKKTLEEIEADVAASEATWLPLAHIAQTYPPHYQTCAEAINTQDSSIHGKGA